VMSRPAISIGQQADLIDHFVSRCTMRGGKMAGETVLMLDATEVEDLRRLADRLRRMAPHETAIRRLVTGRY
jgi:hypothetical protein